MNKREAKILQDHFDEYCLGAQLYSDDVGARDMQAAKAVAVGALARAFGVSLDMAEWEEYATPGLRRHTRREE